MLGFMTDDIDDYDVLMKKRWIVHVAFGIILQAMV